MIDYSQIFNAYLSLEKTDEGMIPRRFTTKQFEAYFNYGECTKVCSKCTASIKMEFYTTDSEFTLNYRILSYNNPKNSFDFYENDVLVYVARIECNGMKNANSIKYKIKSIGKTKISIYLPYNAEVEILDIKIPSIEYGPLLKSRINILTLGDSITQGILTENSSINYPNIVSNYFHANLLNQGVGGYVYSEKCIDHDLPLKPDIILVAYGTNDSIYPDLVKTKTNILNFYQTIRNLYPNSTIITITPIWRCDLAQDYESNQRMDSIKEFIYTIATRFNLNIIDGMSIIPHSEEFFGDAWHPNAKGFQYYAEKVIHYIEENKLL